MEQQRKLSQSSGQPQQQYQSVQDSYWSGITSRILGLQRNHGQNVPSRLPNPIRRTSSQLMPTQNHHQPMFYSAGSSSAAAPQQTMSENQLRPYTLRPQLSDIPMFYSAGSSSAAALQQTMSENQLRPYTLRPQLSDIPMFYSAGSSSAAAPQQTMSENQLRPYTLRPQLSDIPMFYSAGSSSAAAPQQTMSENQLRPYTLRPQLSDIPMFGQEIQEPLYKKQRFPQMSSLSSLPSVSQEAIWQQLEQPVQQPVQQQLEQPVQQQLEQPVQQRLEQQMQQKAQQQVQQQVQQHVPMDVRPVEPDQGFVYVPGMCARRLVSYTLKMQERPTDNNIEFWRDLVSDYFAPDAKKRWCVSQYRKKLSGIPVQDTWNCGICKVKPGRGFEVTPDVLPRLSKMKYDNGAIKERYLLEMPNEYKTASGLIVLQCAKATHETVLKKVRVVREGQLCIVFSPDLKICSWEFCGHHHDEVVQKQDVIPQASDLIITTAKEYEDARNRLKSPAQGPQTSSKFANSANKSAKAARTLVHEVGYEKQYIRSLQTSEVLNSMKDIMKHSKITGSAPRESMVNFTSGFDMSYGNSRNSGQQQEQQLQAQPHAGFTFIQNPSSAVSFQPSTWTNDNQMAMSYFPANGDPINQVYFTGLPTTSVMAQPNHSFAMAPSSSNIPPKVDHSGDQQGGAPSLASFAPKKLRIHPHISTMPVDSTLEAEFNGSPKSLVKIFEEVLKNSQLSGASTAGLEGVVNADNNLNNGNAEIKMDNNLDNNFNGKDAIIDSNPAIPDDFEQQLLFFVEGEDAFNNLDFL